MARRFLNKRDIENVINRVNKEVIEDVVGQFCVIYKIDSNNTQINMYGETAKGGKIYQPGVEIPCLIEANDFDFNTDEFGSDVEQSVEFRFFRDKLIELDFRPEIGDVINWNFSYFEIHSTNENNLIGGDVEENHDLIVSTHMTRQTRLNITDERRI